MTAAVPGNYKLRAIPEDIRSLVKGALGIAGRIIPYSAQRPVLTLALNQAFREPLRQGELDFLNGARVRVKVTDVAMDWLIKVDSDRFAAIDRELKDDVCISGSSLDFILLAARRVDHDSLFFQRRIRIEGDTELGLGLKNTMDSMDWDDLPTTLRKLLQSVGPVVEKLVRRLPEQGS